MLQGIPQISSENGKRIKLNTQSYILNTQSLKTQYIYSLDNQI